MRRSFQKAILKTLIYADTFDYPLKVEEIGKWLIGVRIKNLELRMKNLKNIQEKNGFYFLKGRERIADLRKEREKYSQEKLKIAYDIVKLLKFIPSIRLIGVTGALGVANAKEDDDIDLFIVTSRNLLWTTRFLTTIFTEITGMRRHPGQKSVNNKICLNMFAEEDHLLIPPKEQDIFSAHEVLQMKPLWEKDNIYKKFLYVNKWVKKFLPDAYNIEYEWGINKKITANLETNTADRQYLSIFNFSFLENIIKRFQLWYMRKRRTTEVISEGIIRFHPHDARKWVMREYKKRLDYFRL